MSSSTVLYLVSEPWYFANHRLDHARGLIDAGFDIHVATRDGSRLDEIAAAGCHVHRVDLSRGSSSLVTWAREVAATRRVVRRVRPSVVHAVALKPVALAVTLVIGIRRPSLILSVNGLGISAVDRSRGLVLMIRLLRAVARVPRVELLFQTGADQLAVLGDAGHGVVIPGVGVDLDVFRCGDKPPLPPFKVAYLGRAVRSKGLTDLAAAARDPRLTAAGIEIHAYCSIDDSSPGALRADELEAIATAPALEIHAPTSDPASVLHESHAAILPSRAGEGVSKFVLEALATGTPVLLSATSGSGEVIEDDVTGLTFEASDPSSIIDALLAVAAWPATKRRDVSVACREVAEKSYSLDVIIPQIVALHERAAGDAR